MEIFLADIQNVDSWNQAPRASNTIYDWFGCSTVSKFPIPSIREFVRLVVYIVFLVPAQAVSE
jgi:hypothetical protein